MVLHSLTHAVKTLELLNNQRNSNIFTNFIIYVSGKKFFVHQALVAAHSPVIKRALEASFWNQESSPNISLDGIDEDSFGVLLDFLYSSKLDVNSENVDRLLVTSESLEIFTVVELCKQFKSSEDTNIMDIATDIDDTEPAIYQQSDCPPIKVEVTADDNSSNISSIKPDDDMHRPVAASTIDDEPYKTSLSGSKRGRKPALRLSCPICGKVMTEYRMKAHMRSHTGEKVARCRVCNKSFANIYNLKIHEHIHTGEKPYKCSLCPRAYSDPSSLSKHKLWHSGVKRKKCDVCGRLFATRAHVIEHMRTHTKERPFPCPKCDKMFAYKCDLSRHMRAHNGDLLGPCKYCGRFFTHPGNYRVHLRNHEKKNQKRDDLNACDATYSSGDVTSRLDPTFLLTSDDCEGTVELVGDDNQCRLVKVRDLAELMARGHEIEVVIGDGGLLNPDAPFQKSLSQDGDKESKLVIVDSITDKSS